MVFADLHHSIVEKGMKRLEQRTQLSSSLTKDWEVP